MSENFTDYKFWPIKSKNAGSLIANGQVTVAGKVTVSFSIVKGAKGLFPSLPSDKKADSSKPGGFVYYPKVRFPDNDVYNEFISLTVAEYEKSLSGDPTQGDNSGAGEGNQDFDDGVPF